jgi:hypothetical protein
MKYAWDVFKATMKARLCGMHLFYDRKYDVNPELAGHGDKLGFASSQSFAVGACPAGRQVLQLGIGHANVAAELRSRLCKVTAVDYSANEVAAERSASATMAPVPAPHLPTDVSSYDHILLMDLVEHLHDPEAFHGRIAPRDGGRRPEVIITSANVAFCVTRFMLACGQFNYSRKGILGLGHRRLFTFGSLRALLEQAATKVIEERGVPAPFPLALGENRWSSALLKINGAMIKVSKRLFAYQVCIRARALPDSRHLLRETISGSTALREQLLERVA